MYFGFEGRVKRLNLVGNTDRHWGNWGVCVKNSNNKPVSLHKLMDFNQAFSAYDTIEGANCLPPQVFGEYLTQKEAAVLGVKKIGLNQIKEIPEDCFRNLSEYQEMFKARLEVLKKSEVITY